MEKTAAEQSAVAVEMAMAAARDAERVRLTAERAEQVLTAGDADEKRWAAQWAAAKLAECAVRHARQQARTAGRQAGAIQQVEQSAKRAAKDARAKFMGITSNEAAGIAAAQAAARVVDTDAARDLKHARLSGTVAQVKALADMVELVVAQAAQSGGELEGGETTED